MPVILKLVRMLMDGMTKTARGIIAAGTQKEIIAWNMGVKKANFVLVRTRYVYLALLLLSKSVTKTYISVFPISIHTGRLVALVAVEIWK